MADVQINVKGNFSEVMNQIKSLSGIGTKLTATFSDISAASRLAFGAIDAGSKTANKTIQTLLSRMQSLANSKSPLSDAQLSKELLTVERRYGAGTKATAEFSKLILEAQSTAIRRALEDTTTGINKSLDSLIKSLSSYKLEYTDAEGKQQFQRIGVEAREAIKTLHASIAEVAKKGLEYIDADAINKWGLAEFGSDWTKTGVTGLSLSGSGSAQSELSRVLVRANNEIYKNIKNSIESIVADATASGKKVSDDVIQDLQSRLSALKKGASFDGLTGDALKRRLDSIDKFSKDIIDKVRRYNDGLVEQAGIDKLESRIKALSDTLTRKGKWSSSSGDLQTLFKTSTSDIGVKLTRQFDELRNVVTNTFKREIADFEKLARETGKFDSTTFTSALKSGVDWNVVVEARRRVFAAIQQHNQKQAAEVAKSLADDAREIEDALREAGRMATTGLAPSSKLESLINNYKGKDAAFYVDVLHETRLRALEERIKQSLASTGKLAAGLRQSYEIEAARSNIRLDEGDLPRLFQELAKRKQLELQTAFDEFNEQYASALLRLKEEFIKTGYKQEHYDDFKTTWSRKAGKVGLKFDEAPLIKAVQDAAAERTQIALQKADEQLVKEQQRLVDKVKNTIASAGYKGGSVSVASATPLFGELQSAITSATNNTGSLVVAVSQLRQNVFKGLSAEIKQLEKDALAAGSAIKQSDIAAIQGKIAAASPNLFAHEVTRLNAALANAVKTVDTAVRQSGIDAVRNALTAAANNLQLSSKEIIEQVRIASAELRNLGVARNERVSIGDVLNVEKNQNLGRILQREAQLANNALQKQAMDVLRGLNASAEMSAKVIADARRQFVAAGGSANTFEAVGEQAVTSHVLEVVKELKQTGKELDRGRINYFNNLYQAITTDQLVLEHARRFIYEQAASVNANAQTMRVDALQTKIREVYTQANQLGQVVSKTIEEGLIRQWESLRASLPQGTVGEFRSEFGTEMLQQKTIRANNAMRQMLEGVWKPFAAELDKITVYAQSNVGRQLNGEAFTSEFLQQLNGRFTRVRLALEEQIRKGLIDTNEGTATLTSLQSQFDKISGEARAAITLRVAQSINQLSEQIARITSSDAPETSAAELPKIGTSIERVKADLINTLKMTEANAEAALSKLVANYQQLQDVVSTNLTRNDVMKRANAMLRSQTRSLGGLNALAADLKDNIKAADDLAKEVEDFSKSQAERLRRQAREIASRRYKDYREGASRRGGASTDSDPDKIPEGILRNYRRQIPMQLTDIVVGLSTGQLPMYVLLQQGGQLKDMFGGIGNAVKEVTKYLLGWTDNMTKFQMATAAAKRVLAGIAVGAIAGMALLMKKAADFNSQIKSTTVELKFRGVELSGDEFRNYAERMSQSLGIARTNAAAIFKQIAIDAKLPKESFDSLVEGLEDISTALGNGWDTKGLQETVGLLGEAFKDKDSFLDFASKYAAFNKEQYEAIQQTYDLEGKAKGAALAIQTLAENTQGAAQEAMTPFQETVKTAKEELLKQLQVVGDGMPWGAMASNIATVTSSLVAFIEVVARAAGAVAGLLGTIVNLGRAGVGKALNVWHNYRAYEAENAIGNGAAALRKDLEAATRQREKFINMGRSPDAIASQDRFIAGIKQELSLREEEIRQHKQSAEIWKDGINPSIEAAADAGRLFVNSLTGSAEAAKKIASGIKTATQSVSGLQTFANPKGDKPNKRGGSRSGAKTDKDLENAQRYVQQLKEQYDQVSKMNVAQKLEYDIQEGKVKLQGELLDTARYYASEVVKRAAAEAEAARQLEITIRQEEKLHALENRRREMGYEVAKLIGSDRSAEYFKGLIEFDVELERTLKNLRREQKRSVQKMIDDKKPELEIEAERRKYDKLMAIERQFTADSIELYKQRQKEIDELSRRWTVGYKDGLEEVADWLFSISSEVSSAVQNWADGLADALATAARTGKLSFKDLANSILDDIARIASRQFVSALFGGFQYGWTAIPQSSQSKTAESLMSKSVPQNVFVVNKGFGSFTKAAESLGGITEAVKGGFTLGGGLNTDLGSDPWGLAGTSDKVVQRIGSEVSPAIREGAKSMFSSLFDKIGSIFSGIGSSISNLFNGIKLPSFSFGGGGGGFFSSLFSGIGNFFSSLFGLFASGGYTGSGGKYTPAGIVHKGEFVINAASTRKLGLDFLNRLNGYADGGYVTPTPSIVHSNMSKDMNNGLEVNIYNQTDSKITAQRNSSGGLDIFVEQAVNAVAGNIAAGGAVASAIQRAYALNRGVGTQRTGY